jgi:hypothetical protein
MESGSWDNQLPLFCFGAKDNLGLYYFMNLNTFEKFPS